MYINDQLYINDLITYNVRIIFLFNKNLLRISFSKFSEY